MRGTTLENARCEFMIKPLLGLLLAALLCACEAPLDLEGVESQLAQPLRRSDLMQAVASDGETVHAVGGMGVVVSSDDGGENWRRTVLPASPFLVGVASCPDGRFHVVEKTDGIWSLGADGDWVRQPLPEMTEPQAITCDPSGTLWVTGGFSTILHSTDGGVSWDSWSLDEDLYLTTIQFLDERQGVAIGEFGTVLTTSDGGETWARATELPNSFYPQSAYFTNSAEGWVVGLDGTIWKTSDGAQSWQEDASGTSAPLYGIGGSADSLLAVGENSTVIHREADAGRWSPVKVDTKSHDYLRGVTATGKGRFLVAGGGGVVVRIAMADLQSSTSEKEFSR